MSITKKRWWNAQLGMLFGICASLLIGITSYAAADTAEPVPVIFESDMGNDIDDALALAMLYRYEQEGKVEILGVSNNKQSLHSLRYIDAINRWYGFGHIPIGTVQNGVEGEAESDSFAWKTMELKEDGQQVFYSGIERYDEVRSSVSLYREILSKQPDSTVVIISVGFLTNLHALLQSEPDQFSMLNGKDLVDKKVSRLVVMGGNLRQQDEKEFNIRTDVDAAQYVFDNWPGDVYITPFEVGENLLFPAGPIEENLGYPTVNPLVEGYKLYIPMPYDRPTWDLTAVLFAAEEKADYFRIQGRGKLIVNSDATTAFRYAADGNHRYLAMPTPEEADQIRNRFVELVHSGRKSSGKADPTVFNTPPAAYRPLRILHHPPLASEVDKLKKLGYGGLVTNVSYKDYLNDSKAWTSFRDLVRRTIDSLNMRVWVYDEAGYPSGSAGGEVLKNHPGLEALGLAVVTRSTRAAEDLVIELPYGHFQAIKAIAVHDAASSRTIDLNPWLHPEGTLRWRPPTDGWTVHYFAVKPFYENTHATNNWYAQRKMVNLLEPTIGEAFVNTTHEKYRHVVGDYFGKGIEAFFTDEPALVGTHFLDNKPPVTPQTIDKPDPLLPPYPTLNWSRTLPMEFKNRRGYDLLPEIHQLVGGWSARAAKVRIDYYTMLSEMVADNYFKPIAQFGARNNVASSGHLLLEEDIFYHPVFQGNVHDIYRHMQYPGIDLLTAFPHVAKIWGVTVAKFASSVAQQYNRPHVMSEISNAFDSEQAGITGMIASVGVQYAFGVDKFTSYYLHEKLSESENRMFTDYIGRVGYLLSKGDRTPLVDVYYPIESMYALTEAPLSLGREYFNEEALLLSDNFKHVGLALVNKQVDFNYVDKKRVLEMGASKRPIIVPQLKVMDQGLLEKLRYLAEQNVPLAFQQQHAWLSVPGLPEVVETDLSHYFTDMDHVFFDESAENVVNWINSRINKNYELHNHEDEFVTLSKKGENEEIYLLINTGTQPRTVRFSAKGSGAVRIWNPITGAVESAKVDRSENGWSMPLHFENWQTLIVTVGTTEP